MSPPPSEVRAILLDVEGTTTAVTFVTGVLFPYAREHLETFLQNDPAAAVSAVDELRRERAAESVAGNPPPWRDDRAGAELDSAIAYARWLMDRDRKSTALKSLQGKIWEAGYRDGLLQGSVYPDVAPALERWTGGGRRVAIFSSGSVLAQKLLFSNTPEGDLTRYLVGYFDTTAGPKREPESYRRIAVALGCSAEGVVFVSDVVEELDAARAAGMGTRLCVRPGSAPPVACGHPVVRSFDELLPGAG